MGQQSAAPEPSCGAPPHSAFDRRAVDAMVDSADNLNCPWGQHGMLSWCTAGNVTEGVVRSTCVSRAAVLTSAQIQSWLI